MNPTFSQRRGIEPFSKDMQLQNMDQDLRNGIWNVLLSFGFNHYHDIRFNPIRQYRNLYNFIENLYSDFFKWTTDLIPSSWYEVQEIIKNRYNEGPYNKVYDLIEFLYENFPFGSNKEHFVERLNEILEKEFCGYRLVNGLFAEITNSEEINEINVATKTSLSSVNEHIEMALSHLSDRENPDYRNSIKESISAVESICKKITGDIDTTMGKALKQIESKGTIELHSDMKEAFQKLYSYTSDSGGIRHSLMEGERPPDFDDAKFMLVSCSAIVNYLISKATKAKIQL